MNSGDVGEQKMDPVGKMIGKCFKCGNPRVRYLSKDVSQCKQCGVTFKQNEEAYERLAPEHNLHKIFE